MSFSLATPSLSGPAVTARSNAVRWQVKVDGSTLKPELDNAVLGGEVVSALHGPSSCVIEFSDPRYEVLATTSGVRIGAALVITCQDSLPIPIPMLGGPPPGTLFDGEIVAIESIADGGGGSVARIRALDRLHRLFRGRNSKTFLMMTASEIATQIAAENGLTPAGIESTSDRFEFVVQHHESDGAFLERLAAEAGSTLRVQGRDLIFAPPPSASAAAAVASPGSSSATQLVLGDDVTRCEVVLSSEFLADDVEVRSWDPVQKEDVVASARVPNSLGDRMASIAEPLSATASAFGAKTFTVGSVPHASQAMAETAAKAVANQIAAARTFVRLESVGNPSLLTGTPISLGPPNHPMSGKYVLTTAVHRISGATGFISEITCGGLDGQSLPSGVPTPPVASTVNSPVSSVAIGVVTDADDPQKLGRVKVKMPWLSSDLESDWMRVVSIGAGKDRGWYVLPEVNDEVLVAFEHGDMRRGFVLGGLWNGKDSPAQRSTSQAVNRGVVVNRSFTSRTGQHLLFVDDDDQPRIEIQSGDEKLLLTFDQTAGTITLDGESGKSQVVIDKAGDVTVATERKVLIQSKQEIVVDATEKLTLKGKNVEIEAIENLVGKGRNTTIEAMVNAEMKGTTEAKVTGAKVALEGQALAEVKATLVKIN